MNLASKQNSANVFWRIGGVFMCAFLILAAVFFGQREGYYKRYVTEESVQSVNWSEILGGMGYAMRGESVSEEKEEEKISLYARSAALIDADTGRVLYGKDELTEYPMASTTKIMTCIIALEHGNLDDVVTVSSYAASQPEVRLGIRSGEQYILRDLLFGTMLTSYNDCAVAIAEHIGGSVEGFAALMNEKARDLGCFQTWFITPNGLDAENEGGVHRTTAEDLARILAYAVKNEEFLEITQKASHSFTDCKNKRSFTAVNKNAFLSMMDGALSGKTGYTNDAGYCYTGALTRDGRTYAVALLGSGWPPNKNWKWSDTRTLISYGLENYELTKIGQEGLVTEAVIPVEGGTDAGARITLAWSSDRVLMRTGEHICAEVHIPESIKAPMPGGAVIGYICIYLEDVPLLYIPAVLEEPVQAFSWNYCVEHIFAGFFDILNKV